ncbi:MAG: hypothetical protein NVSMB30_30190 [Hymenobacter sp.]
MPTASAASNASTALTLASLTSVAVGQLVTGAGIPAGTTVVGPLPATGTTITLSAAATVALNAPVTCQTYALGLTGFAANAQLFYNGTAWGLRNAPAPGPAQFYRLAAAGTLAYPDFNTLAENANGDPLELHSGGPVLTRAANTGSSSIIGQTGTYLLLAGFNYTVGSGAYWQDFSILDTANGTGGMVTLGPSFNASRGYINAHILLTGGQYTLDNYSFQGVVKTGTTYGVEGTGTIVLRNGANVTGTIDPRIVVVAAGGVQRGPFAASTTYAQYDTVTNAGTAYYANKAFTSGASFVSTDWTALPGGSGAATPVATTTAVGTVQVGSGLAIPPAGLLSATASAPPAATAGVAGVVKIGANVTVATDGTISVAAPGVTAAQLETVRNSVTLSASQAAAYTLAATDVGNIVPSTATAAVTWTVPASVFTAGQVVEVLQNSASQVTLVGGTGMTLTGAPGLKTSGSAGSRVSILFMSASAAFVYGTV